jgi:hypothetical protein
VMSTARGPTEDRGSDCHGPFPRLWTRRESRAFPAPEALSPVDLLPGPEAVTKRRELLPDAGPASPSPCNRVLPLSVGRVVQECEPDSLSRFVEAGARRLGPTHPWPFAVPMEACSTSVFQALSILRIVATTTKICTTGGSTAASRRTLQPLRPAFLLIEPTRVRARWRGFGRSLQRPPFSGLLHSAGKLLHTS